MGVKISELTEASSVQNNETKKITRKTLIGATFEKLLWGTSMSFQMKSGQHALVMLNDTDCLMIWAAGLDPNNPTVTFNRLSGTDANVTNNGTTITISYTNNRYFTGNAIIS